MRRAAHSELDEGWRFLHMGKDVCSLIAQLLEFVRLACFLSSCIKRVDVLVVLYQIAGDGRFHSPRLSTSRAVGEDVFELTEFMGDYVFVRLFGLVIAIQRHL